MGPFDPSARHGRTIDLLGQDGFGRLRDGFVVVLGLGGVGGHAALALARAGLGRLRLVDFDQVTPSSLNRSAFATEADLGCSKASVAQRQLAAVDPDVQVETLEVFFHHDTADAVLAGGPDMVVDAIDSVTPKVALLTQCVERRLPVVSCMGASGRTDPTLLRVQDIAQTYGCPLARVMRRQLRRAGITRGITAVFSVEEPRAPLAPDEEEETLRRGRVRNRLPSLGIMPAVMGYTAAAVIVSRLAGLPPPGTAPQVPAPPLAKEK